MCFRNLQSAHKGRALKNQIRVKRIMERRTFIKNSGLLGLATVVTPAGIFQSRLIPNVQDQLELNFQNPPASAKPHTWWHWMNGNVTKEGITLDLEAMARVGIGGFQNFDAGTGIPKGPIVYLSPEWFELKKHTIDEANRLGLEFTMHNCPGWSSSGGPWITPELSMQEVTWSELVIDGGKSVNINLPRPFQRLDTYADISVIACKSFPGEVVIKKAAKRIRSNKGVVSAERITGEDETFVKVEPEQSGEGYIEFEWNRPLEIQQISFITAAYGEHRGPIVIQTSEDGKSFKALATFNTGSRFGEPRGEVPFTQNVPMSRASYLRIVCNHERAFSQIRFSPQPRPEGWAMRSNYEFNRTGVPDLSHDLPAIAQSDIIDVTKFMKADGSFSWKAPAGTWTIMRFGFTPMGTLNRSAPDTGVGLECDKFSAQAFKFHFSKMMENLLPFLKPLGEKGKVGLLIDSYEVGMQNWTLGFEKIFKERRGYEIIPYLPALTGRVVSSSDLTNRFLWDLRRTQGDLMADNYYGKFNELCHKNDIISYIQPYDRGPMEEMQIGSRIDVNVGEFWNNLSSIFQNNWTMRRTVKLSASIAHTNGQKIVAAESFTGEPESAKWQEHPLALKMVGDRMFAQGLNRMIFHRFAHQPHPTVKPGMTMGPWGSHFDRTNTWWEQGKAWMQYLSRCQYLLQEGNFVADIAYFSGEDAGVYTRVEPTELYPVPPEGYDYDVINSETLLKKAGVKNKRLALSDGMSYAVLALQNHKTMTLELLMKLREFVNDGLTVIGEKPSRTPGLPLNKETEFTSIVDELWRPGKIVSAGSLQEVLTQLGLTRDFECSSRSGDAPIVWLHRKTSNEDIYFLANQRRSAEQIVCTFRIANRQPEIWNPVTGKRIITRVFKAENGTITIPLTMDPVGSLFVVFRNEIASPTTLSVRSANDDLLPLQHFGQSAIRYREIHTNFSVSLWAKPETSVMLGTNNFMDGQEPWTDFYALYPAAGETLYGPGHATVGLAVGRNGVVIWENSKGKPVFKESIPVSLSGWTHIALVYQDGSPRVYLNGMLSKEGAKSELIVHPAADGALLRNGASFFNGDMLPAVVLDEVLSAESISRLAQARPDSKESYSDIINDGEELVLLSNGKHTISDSKGETSFNVQNGELIDLSTDWLVEFPPGNDAPDSIKLPRLQSLHTHEVPGVKYFSGSSSYKKIFKMPGKINPATTRYFLDLGEVEVIAEVWLNNQKLGTLWTRPFLLDITDHLHGENQLVVMITNLWPNRLIGDEQVAEPYKYAPGGGGSGFASLSGGAILELPDWYRKGEPKPDDGKVTFATWKHYTKDSPLLQSGLIGPVVLRTGLVKKIT
jgi:hypothetical protein